ncbi:MAG: zinc-dependent metalloprotease [Gemmatimonadota bacterium]|nr:zinc-dependent metalloprotease [Gemmatimonadota bacterium]
MVDLLSRLSLAAALIAIAATTACRPAPPRTAPAPAATPDVTRSTTDTAGRPPGPGGPAGPAGAPDPSPRPYARVITKDAKTREGMFKTHRAGSKLLFEIPAKELGKDLLLVTQIAKTTLGVGYGGEQIGSRVLRWERRENRVFLRNVNYNVVADTALPIAQAVAAANYHPIIAAFNVEAYGPDSAAVIDVTRMYTGGAPELGVGTRIRGTIDVSRSFVERVAGFPDNVEVEATHTYNPPPPPPPPQNLPFQLNFPPGQSQSMLMHWSMVRLPEQPMMPRLADKRVGYFTVNQLDFGTSEQRVARRSYINRYRLECSEQRDGELCIPKKPITYYVDPATPRWLVPFIKSGIEAWQPAFEEAGFKNAILAKDAPSPVEDPDWSAEDARYSVIRWVPSTIENAIGPNVVDPRTGEIIEADVRMFHNIMNLQRSWYFTQVAPLDPRAQTLPFPDSLMGRLVEYVVAHEIGHTLGFPHNMKASSTYPVDSVRARSFVERMGHTPTLMDYSRFNYVAQPEDSIPPALLIPGVGPYDRFATMWGYKPIPGARTPDEEKPTLDRWARAQDSLPYLRFSTSGALGADPGDQTEAVGDADAVRATMLGLKNIKRVVPMLERAATREGEDYADLSELYTRLTQQWATELRHVATLVGGAESQEKYVGQNGVRFTPVPRARQREAVRFLNEQAFRTPDFFLDPRLLRKIEVEGAIDRIGNAQRNVLNILLDNNRLARLIEFEALAARPADVYKLGDMLADLRRGVWSELSAPSPTVDAFRRRLQRNYVEIIGAKINPPQTPPQVIQIPGGGTLTIGAARQVPDARALLRGELRDLDTALRTAVGRTSDRTTRLHLEDARNEIDKILNPQRGR